MNATIKVITPANRLYALAHEKAVAKVGKDVFAFQNNTVKHALVAVEIIHIVNGQDEDSPAEKRCNLLFSLSLCNAEKYGNN